MNERADGRMDGVNRRGATNGRQGPGRTRTDRLAWDGRNMGFHTVFLLSLPFLAYIHAYINTTHDIITHYS